jgi:hypothetical protein
VQTRGNRLIVLGQARIRAILQYLGALSTEQEQSQYLQRIRATLQVSPSASDDEMIAAMQEFANAS